MVKNQGQFIKVSITLRVSEIQYKSCKGKWYKTLLFHFWNQEIVYLYKKVKDGYNGESDSLLDAETFQETEDFWVFL